ncbi:MULTISPECIES: YtcA family lipoprotein [Acetobacter]|uniref:YtcA family lipoprotein n=1 Tax=Acetobacter TaxID=434 RepID=UPI00376F5343
MRYPSLQRAIPVLLLPLTGCKIAGAPSFPLAGAYFPSWMLCGLLGILVAVGLRVLFLATDIDALLRLRLFTYVSLGTITGLLFWLLAFGP